MTSHMARIGNFCLEICCTPTLAGYDPFIALESLIGHEHAKSKIQVVINALQVNRRRVAAGGKAEPPHVVIAGRQEAESHYLL